MGHADKDHIIVDQGYVHGGDERIKKQGRVLMKAMVVQGKGRKRGRRKIVLLWDKDGRSMDSSLGC